MKLRFRENSLRLRLNRNEVQRVAAGEALTEQIVFPGASRIAYVLESGEMAAPAATYRHDTIRISAPKQQVQLWAQGESIGLYFDLPADGELLRVAIEKDLACVDGPESERDPEAFPRPLGEHVC